MSNKFFKVFLIATILVSLTLPIEAINAKEYVEILNTKASLTEKGAVKIEWLTNTETQAKVIYGETSDNLNRYVIINGNPSTHNSVEIGGLRSKTTYYYQIIVYRDSVESARSFINKIKTETIKDSFAPIVEDLQIPFAGGSVAVIQWHTSEASNSVVEYGTYQAYNKKATNKTKVKDHIIVLKKLIPDERYYIRVYSVDDEGEKSNYVYKIFNTLPKITHDYDDVAISYLRPSGPDDIYITSDSITVKFKTNRYAKGQVSLNKGKSKANIVDLEYGTEHKTVFYDLDPETTYTLTIIMSDPFGKKAKEILTIKTKEKEVIQPAPKEDEVIVSGIEHSYFTSSEGLYKYEGNSGVFTILSGKKHYITSPSSFYDYGYEWNNIKTIKSGELKNISRVKLVKSPDKSAVYYLYEGVDGRLFKMNIPSSEVFESYSGNKWEDVVKISEIDINNYPDVKLIKAVGSSDIYFLDNNIKRLVSQDVFKIKGFSQSEVFTVNQKHIDSYPTGYSLK